MLAREVKRIIRQVFEKGCRDLGFHRTKLGGLGWYHPVDDHYFVITFRTPRAWNRHWGGFLECKLCIRDQINPRIPWRRKTLEYLIASLASEVDREAMRRWYNEAAAMTTNPVIAPEDLTILEGELCEMLRIPLQAPLSASDNEFLLRFCTEEDLRRWAMFILERIPEWMEKITALWRSSYETTGPDMKAHQPFLDAIQADPESEVPRLAYADWLADRGDAWSEVIRIQCRYPNGYMPWKTADQLEDLLTKHQYRFDRGADDLSVHVKFQRGMVEEIICSAERFLKAGKHIMETFPLANVLSLYKIQGRGMRLANQPQLLAMRSLKIRELADDDWQWIVRSPYLDRVQKLRVAFPRPIDLAWLLDMPLARQLRVLDLTWSCLDASILTAFGETDAASGLDTLVLDDTDLDDEMVQCLSKIATLRGLKRLSITDNPRIGIDGITSILEAEFAPRLELLSIGTGCYRDDVVRQLAESQLSSNVHLWLKHGSVGIDGIDKVKFKERFPNCSFGDDFIERQL